MDWVTHAQERRRRFWPVVEAFFGALPPDLYRQGVLLRHDLATAYTDSGQFEDLLKREVDYPRLDLPGWLLDDWGRLAAGARAELEQPLFAATVFTFCAAFVRESILDEASNFDAGFYPLAEALTQGAVGQLAQLFPTESPFWDHSHALSDDYARALRHLYRSSDPSTEDELRLVSDRLAFAKIPVVAVALRLGQPYASQLPVLLGIVDDLNLAFQLCRDIATLRRDLWLGRRTYPIARTRRAAGIGPGQAATPEQVLGAAVLTGTISQILAEARQRLETRGDQAKQLGLPTLGDYLATAINHLEGLVQFFSLGPNTRPSLTPARIFVPAHPASSLKLAIEMAERYLLSDLTWRESWEVQRREIIGAPELTGRAFAPGLVLEALCQHRTDLAEQVEAQLQVLADHGYRYFPNPHVPPDADDLGLALRLLAYVTPAQFERHRQQLQQPLRWMEANIAESGQIACWFTRGREAEPEDGVMLWGNTCLTVEANLLLGLLAHDRAAYRPLLQRSASHWVDRWVRSGLGSNTLYAPHYALWAAVELLARLSHWPGSPIGQDQMLAAYERCRQHWRTQIERVHRPQEAAFLTRLSLRAPDAAGLRDGFDLGWIQLMVKNQRYDGSWAAEPLYVTPTRGEVATWYSSRLVTTAYIWHALKTYAGGPG